MTYVNPFAHLFLFLANGIKCYTCKVCTDKGTEEECGSDDNACQKLGVGPAASKKCWKKDALGLGCKGFDAASNCVCDTDLCNGSATVEMKPILLALSALLTKFVH